LLSVESHRLPTQEPEAIAAYTVMTDATPADLDLQTAAFSRTCSPEAVMNRVIAILVANRGCFIGNHIDMYEHNLQCATRALRAGEPEETIVVALLHDIGEAITPNCHGEIAGAMLRPCVLDGPSTTRPPSPTPARGPITYAALRATKRFSALWLTTTCG
jgi:hypothetical protein